MEASSDVCVFELYGKRVIAFVGIGMNVQKSGSVLCKAPMFLCEGG